MAPSGILDDTPGGHLAGDSLRAKVCHFVRARLLSAFSFLAINSNQSDACILLNCCFERMAYLTLQPDSLWIEPVYDDLEVKRNAEKSYQAEVFFHICEKFAQHKTYVDRVQLQSQFQFDLQKYISQVPINIRSTHFKTEMYNPKNSHLNLQILQTFFSSTEFLKITKYIYELSRFYLLLHQTYAQLIKRDNFIEITLKQLHDRAKEHLTNYTYAQRRNEARNHMDIITKGIEAVNAYHTFTNGLIQPGPCNQTQHFTKISIDTPVHFLVTNENPDEGDIIMQILRFSIQIFISVETPLSFLDKSRTLEKYCILESLYFEKHRMITIVRKCVLRSKFKEPTCPFISKYIDLYLKDSRRLSQ